VTDAARNIIVNVVFGLGILVAIALAVVAVVRRSWTLGGLAFGVFLASRLLPILVVLLFKVVMNP
jgi:hypothetical protein